MRILRTIEAHSAGRTILHDGKPLALDKRVTQLLFAKGHLLVGSEDFTASLWNVATGEKLCVLTTERVQEVKALAISPDGKLALTGHGAWGVARMWDLEAGAHVRELVPEMYIDAVAFSKDGAAIYVAKGAGLWQFETESGQGVCAPKSEGMAALAAFDPAATLLLVARKKAAALHSVPAEKKKKALPAHSEDVTAIGSSADGALIATADVGEVRAIDLATGKTVAARKVDGGFHEGITSVAIRGTPGEPVLATGHQDGVVRLWLDEVKTSDAGHGMSVDALAFDPSGEILAAGAYDGTVTLLEAK